MTKLPFRGVWLPGEVFMDERLSQSSKLLWGIVHILSNERGCYASRATLAEYMRCSERNVQLLIEELIAHGFVRRHPDGTLWDIWLGVGGEENFTGGVKNPSPEGVKKTSPNSNKSKIGITDEERREMITLLSQMPKELSKTWEEYVELRKARKWTRSDKWQLKQVRYLTSGPSGLAVEALRTSIRNEWQSVHIKGAPWRPSAPAKTDADHGKGF